MADERTFSVTLETRKGTLRDLVDRPEGVAMIHADPMERKMEDGSTRISMGFPVLLVTSWVAEPEEFARKVAKLLEEHRS